MFESYAIGVRINLLGMGAIASGLQIFSSHLRTAHGDAEQLERRLNSIRGLAIAGGITAGAGFLGLSALKRPLEEAKLFDQQLQHFKLYGLSEQVNRNAEAFATGMDVIGTSATDAMKLVREAQGVFRESGLSGMAALEGAKLAAPMLAKIAFATSGLDENQRAATKASSLDMLRFVELRGGLNSPEQFNQIANAGWKAIQSSGGNIDWGVLRQVMARGGVATQQLSDRSLFGLMEPIWGELKGNAAVGLQTAHNRLAGVVKLPNQIAHLLAESGVWDASKIKWNAMGGIKSFDGNPLSGENYRLMVQSPSEFYERVMLPMYSRMNLATPVDRARENALIFGREGGKVYSLIDRQLEVMHRSEAAWMKSLGLDQSVNVAGKTLQGQELALEARRRDGLRELGVAVLPIAIRGVEGLSSVLKSFNQFAHDSPRATRGLVLGLAGLSSALLVGGGVTLLAAGVRGLGLAASVLGPPLVGVSRLLGGALVSGLSTAARVLPMVGSAVLVLGRALLMNPVGLVVSGIAAAAYTLYRNWDSVKGPILKGWEIIKAAFNVSTGWVVKNVQDMWATAKPYIGQAIEVGAAVARSVGGAFGTVYETVSGWMGKLLDWFKASPIGKAIGLAYDGAKLAIGVAEDYAGQKLNQGYAWAVAENHAASYSHEGRRSVIGSLHVSEGGESRYVRGLNQGKPQAINNTIVMPDGRVLANVVTEVQAKEAGRALSGSTGFDGSQFLAPPSLR